MKIDALVAEIGSTTTVINAFNDLNTPCPKFLGQGVAPTSVLEGDVTRGLKEALLNLEKSLNTEGLSYDAFYATSSAAGGLKMTVHGLVYDMTVRAAKEAALGAGANIHFITSGKLRKYDLKKIKEIEPNIILLSGGVDYGERNTACDNGEALADLNLKVPLIYAGNIENREVISEIFHDTDYDLFLTENVYPKIDALNTEPTKAIIQKAFEKHIIHAPGMEKVKSMVSKSIIPTPGAVMLATQLFHEAYGDVITLDIGGATTDIHSVTEGSEAINRILLQPEPDSKRTVEGDLGVYVNRENVLSLVGEKKMAIGAGVAQEEIKNLVHNLPPIPRNNQEVLLTKILAKEALKTALNRHSGRIRHLYTGTGKKSVAEGKDLTAVKYIIGTGGPLTRLSWGDTVIEEIIRESKDTELMPSEEAKVLVDHQYIMASLGILSLDYPEAARILLCNSLELKEEGEPCPTQR